MKIRDLNAKLVKYIDKLIERYLNLYNIKNDRFIFSDRRMLQECGRSNITDFEEVVALDMKYIKEWDGGLYVKILFKTVAVVLHKDSSM